MNARIALAFLLLAACGGAVAEVKSASASGFEIVHELEIDAGYEASWAALARPGKWWPKAHTWSGDAANLSLELEAGGCFCERWKGGSAEHGRVVMVEDTRLLRMVAPLGPLQSMALSAVLTVELKHGKDATRAVVSLRASGDASHALDQLAPAVDRVLGEQFGRWVVYARDCKLEP